MNISQSESILAVETDITYKDAFVTMQPIFIAVCYIEFFIFTCLALRLTCKYLPIVTTSMVSILLMTMFCYLVQAALFSRVRKLIGDKIVSDDFDVEYDVYLRLVSCVQWLIYLSFFIIIFII